jgi:crossover junction endodeoxyribonuclease RusA
VSRQLEFFVPGTPRPQGSHDPRRRGPRGQLVNHPNLELWRDDVAHLAMGERRGHWPTATGAVSVSLWFAMNKTKAHGFPADYPIGPPDIDKLTRAILDALVRAQLFADDAQVVSLAAHKHWEGDVGPGVLVRISLIEDVRGGHGVRGEPGTGCGQPHETPATRTPVDPSHPDHDLPGRSS